MAEKSERTTHKDRANHVKERAAAVKKEVTKRVAQKVKPAAPNSVTSNRLKLLITIVSRGKAEYYTDLIQSFDVNMQLIALANGTATAKMLGILGFTDTEKAVIFGVIQENKIPDAMHTLQQKFETIRDGKGIAFTVPLTSVIGTLVYGFLSNNKLTVKESK